MADTATTLTLSCGRTVPLKMQRRSAARRFVLRVSRGVIQLTIPTKASAKAARRWAMTNESFIREGLTRSIPPRPFTPGLTVPLFGQERSLVMAKNALSVAELAVPARSEASFGKAAERVLRERALEAGEEALERFWRRLGVSDAPVTVRSYKRRWGSCRSDGATSLNWRLVFAPRFVFDHVCAHEAVHRLHMNHGAGFKTTLALLDPRADEASAWLRDHGESLHAWGSESER